MNNFGSSGATLRQAASKPQAQVSPRALHNSRVRVASMSMAHVAFTAAPPSSNLSAVVQGLIFARVLESASRASRVS